MKTRTPGIDLIRCLALLLVNSFHFYLFNGYYHVPQTGAAMLLAGSTRWLTVSCNGLYIMITGYLKSTEPFTRWYYRSLPGVLAGYYLAAAVSIPVRHLLLGDVQPFAVWLTRLLQFSGVYYGWFVGMYIGLLLISPLVNLAVAQINEKQLLWLCAGVVAVTALPGATTLPIFPTYWRAAFPLCYYLLGAAVRKLQPRVRVWQGIAAALGIALCLGIVTLLSTDGKLETALTWEFGDLWIVLITLCLFVSLYRLPLGARTGRIAAWCAKGCFGGYLLSHLLDSWAYAQFPALCKPQWYGILFLIGTVPIWLVCMAAGRVLDRAANALVHGLTPQRLKRSDADFDDAEQFSGVVCLSNNERDL